MNPFNIIPAALYRSFVFFIGICLLNACDDPYTPKELINPDELLVVEGFIEINDVSVFKISKTRNLKDASIEKPVDQASAWIEGEDNSRYPLHSAGSGTYQSESLSLNPALKYRVNISLGTNAMYASDFVEAKSAPPIDSVYWEIHDDGVQLFINTHDPSANTRYYRWAYDETWQFRVPYPTLYIYDPNYSGNDHVRLRNSPQELVPAECYTSATSTKIIINNTSALAEDVIYKLPICKIDLSSNRLQIRYSMLVKQYAFTKEAYQYWEDLKKVSDNMGSLFDAQPYQLTGNIHKVGSAEKVIGYISAGSKSTKRIFISKYTLPNYVLQTIYDGCTAEIGSTNYLSNIYVPLGNFPDPKNPASSVPEYTTMFCADCSKVGDPTPPDFW